MYKAHLFLFFCCISLFPKLSYGWGRTGHSIVAEIAFQYLDDSTKQTIKTYLGDMSIEDAANWMDEMRSNHDYDYMKPWHYIDIEKGGIYQPGGENIITELQKVLGELSHQKTIPHDEVRLDVLILFHLIGDLHQPLHTGYPIDKGGNTIKLTFLSEPSNLHKVWDDGIIDIEHITTNTCLEAFGSVYSNRQKLELQNIDVVEWMNQSRLYLDSVYDFSDDNIDITYCQKNRRIVERQLFLAGIRLAGILEAYFKDAPKEMVSKETIILPKGTITPDEAINHVGQKVTVCGKVFGGKYLEESNGKPTFINIGAAFPNSPFTVVIFNDDRINFDYKPEEFLNNKQICVTGTVKEYKGKAEIIVSKESQIVVK